MSILQVKWRQCKLPAGESWLSESTLEFMETELEDGHMDLKKAKRHRRLQILIKKVKDKLDKEERARTLESNRRKAQRVRANAAIDRIFNP